MFMINYDQQRGVQFIQQIQEWLCGRINDDIMPANPNGEITFHLDLFLAIYPEAIQISMRVSCSTNSMLMA